MYKHFLIIISVLMLSCKVSKQNISKNSVDSLIEKDSMNILDLSGMNLKKLPDLSEYYIENLVLRENKLESINSDFFPKGLKSIDISYNSLKGYVKILENGTLKFINLSHNKINKVFIGDRVKNLNLSDNQLTEIQINYIGNAIMDTLNISNNRGLNNIVHFQPSSFKRIIKDNIKNNKELIWIFEAPIVN